MTPEKLDKAISLLLEASCNQALAEYSTRTSPESALRQVQIFLQLAELRKSHDRQNSIQRKWSDG